MDIETIRNALRKSAIIFIADDNDSSDPNSESWIGSVQLRGGQEDIPVDVDGEAMIPLASLYVDDFGFALPELSGINRCNVYISRNIYDHLNELDGYFAVIPHKNDDQLIQCDLQNPYLQPGRVKSEMVDDDYPMWDCIPTDTLNELIRLENEGDFEYGRDIQKKSYDMHKVGGYPAYIQDGSAYPNEQFVFQISSDPSVNLNIVDNGSFYFFYDSQNNKWTAECDFF
ncbi:MAG: DUF1963 domain-containing protein [Saccharofermentans sp.]|nr:DUF1963 domain-containing protein [Saccharofermentans sp.]